MLSAKLRSTMLAQKLSHDVVFRTVEDACPYKVTLKIIVCAFSKCNLALCI